MKKLTSAGCLPLSRGYIHIYNHYFPKIFFSETNWPINVKFNVGPPWKAGKKIYIDGTGHMTRMAAMPIYGKNQKSYDLETWHVALGTQALQSLYKR